MASGKRRQLVHAHVGVGNRRLLPQKVRQDLQTELAHRVAHLGILEESLGLQGDENRDLVVLLGSLGFVPFLGAEFIPRLDEGAIAMQIWRLPSISLEQSNKISGMAEAATLGFHPVYLALAIGCGSKPIAWMNDSGFWVICKMSGMTEGEGLKFVTPMSAAMGAVGIAVTMIGAWLFPMTG